MTYETSTYIWILLTFILAMAISYFATPVVNVLAHKVGAIDVPNDARRMHKTPIPRLGGLSIFSGFLIATLAFSPISPQLRSILLGAVFIVILGVIDDIISLKAWIKLLGQIGAAMFPVLSGIRIEAMTNLNFFSDNPYMSFGVFSIPITIIWIVGITNAVNLIDGLDGLAVGVSSIASVSLLLIALIVSEPGIALLMAALAGGCIGFMPFNINPAKMFMGDTGAMFLGYILASVSILGLFKFYAVLSFAIPFLILGLPIFDTSYAIIRRLAQGRSPMSPDRGHLHHKLIDMGFSQKQTVAILYAMSGILGLSAVLLTGSGAEKAIILLLTMIIASFIAYRVYDHESKKRSEQTKDDEKQ